MQERPLTDQLYRQQLGDEALVIIKRKLEGQKNRLLLCEDAMICWAKYSNKDELLQQYRQNMLGAFGEVNQEIIDFVSTIYGILDEFHDSRQRQIARLSKGVQTAPSNGAGYRKRGRR